MKNKITFENIFISRLVIFHQSYFVVNILNVTFYPAKEEGYPSIISELHYYWVPRIAELLFNQTR